MKYHMGLKFLAFLLCAACLLTSILAGISIALLIEWDLYNITVEDLQLEQCDQYSLSVLAEYFGQRIAARQLSNFPQEALERYLEGSGYKSSPYFDLVDTLCYEVNDAQGRVVDYHHDRTLMEGTKEIGFQIRTTYPVVLKYSFTKNVDLYPEGVTTPSMPLEETGPTETTQSEKEYPVPDGAVVKRTEEWAYQNQEGLHRYSLGICAGPVYTVTLHIRPDTFVQAGSWAKEDHWSWQLAKLGYVNRYNLIWVLVAALVLFVALLVYLCCAAGRKPGREEVLPGGLNRLPLDLYGVFLGFFLILSVQIVAEMLRWGVDRFEPIWLLGLGVGAVAYVACMLPVAFLFALAAQVKAGGFYWAKHSLVGLSLKFAFLVIRTVFRWLVKALKWVFSRMPALWVMVAGLFAGIWNLVKSIFAFLRKLVKGFCGLVKRVCLWLWRGVVRFFTLLPLTWQWLMAGFAIVFILLITLEARDPGFLLLGLVVCGGAVLYGAHAFGTLLEGTKRMSQGDLRSKVDEKYLLGGFRDYAGHLNALADVAMEAARSQMRSERMKAELVTNVSHDIKTPLTSIINYVDLLQKAQSQEEAEAYLEVLSRQSQRLKKLIEDLMELSKASTGNMNVELTRVDAGEAIHQALGEFSPKLEQAKLVPVFTAPAAPVYMKADGRLTWRVLSNLLSNAVKYAMPGTRLYVDLAEEGSRVRISLKNISAQQLNVNSEELLERFVRGDASRNTEGSGLGLNISKNLMELQGGSLQLTVDGDLFKVTLLFDRETG